MIVKYYGYIIYEGSVKSKQNIMENKYLTGKALDLFKQWFIKNDEYNFNSFDSYIILSQHIIIIEFLQSHNLIIDVTPVVDLTTPGIEKLIWVPHLFNFPDNQEHEHDSEELYEYCDDKISAMKICITIANEYLNNQLNEQVKI